jgi:hypothetical protein
VLRSFSFAFPLFCFFLLRPFFASLFFCFSWGGRAVRFLAQKEKSKPQKKEKKNQKKKKEKRSEAKNK